jgi:hypothetical protein
LLQEQGIGLQGGVNLGEDGGQLLLFRGQLILEVGDAVGEILCLRAILSYVRGQDSLGGVGKVIQVNAEVIRKTGSGGIPKKV